MPEKNLAKAAILMVIITLLALGGWEAYLRSKGVGIAYDQGPALWADKRARVYESPEKATVFIGSSRIKYDLDIPTWEKITGKQAIQLAVQGSSPMRALQDLANDPKFKGRVVVDVTEALFFSKYAPLDVNLTDGIHYFYNSTPSQNMSFQLDRVLESQLVFLDQDYLSINAGLDNLQIRNRPGVFELPPDPLDFDRNTFARQSKMSDRFLRDTSLQNRVKNLWIFLIKAGIMTPPTPATVAEIAESTKSAVDKIRSRGGDVLFIRTPCSGPMEEGELKAFPKNEFWDKLIKETGCTGIYYKDFPSMSGFICPEWSHLSPSEAAMYTKALIKALPESFVH